jgi:hypothetical protein
VRTRARDARTEFVGRAQSFGGRIGEMLAGL